MDDNKYLDVLYAINQALINKIDNDILNISFSMQEEKIEVMVFLIENLNKKSLELIEEFKMSLIEKLSKLTFIFSQFELTKEQFNNYQFTILKYCVFEKALA